MTARDNGEETFYSLVERLPRDTDWERLRESLELRLIEAQAGRDHLSVPERQLLAGLRLRARYLSMPYYARRDERGPAWWIALKGSEGASQA